MDLYRPWRIAYFVITVLAAVATVCAACVLVLWLLR
jgi:hypothetical protein